MRSVHALLIGISDYPHPVSRLYGCMNDVNLIDGWLRETFGNDDDYRYHPSLLLDSKATRQQVIDSFAVFNAASGDDICIFYYSGHGSLVKTNTTYWSDGSDYLNSLVCYDSRLPGGYDLVDKELAYLIWKATENKPDLHFVSIMDCCFAGSNTRDVTEISRMFERNEIVKQADELLGYDHFVNGVPPRGRYVALSASQSNQTSKEKIISGQYYGVFSFFLVQCLRQTKGAGGYHSLVERVKLYLGSNTREQVPMIEVYASALADKVFGITALPITSSWLLFYNDGWKLNKGSVHGVSPGLQCVLADGQTAEVGKVYTTESSVSIASEPDRALQHPVWSKTTIPVTLNFFIDDDSGNIRSTLDNKMAAVRYEGIRFTDDSVIADYFIRYDNQRRLAMTDARTASIIPRFTNVPDIRPEIFLERLQQVARWASVVNLCNPAGQGFAEQIDVSLFAVETNSVQRITNPAEYIFKYTISNSVLVQPRLQCKIKNNGPRPVYASILYCGCDFAVSNELLADTLIDPGHEISASFINQQKTQSQSIPVNIPSAYQRAGLTKVTDFLVLLFSNTPVSSADLCMPALPLENDGSDRQVVTRGVGSTKPTIQMPGWGTIKIPVRIEK